MRLVVGLGNPTQKYNRTRHNIGREFIDVLAEQSKQSFLEDRQADILRLPNFFGAKLGCFMNESGRPIQGLMAKERLKPKDLLIIVDDFMIPFGTLRLRPKGSAGGHNGLKSIIETLGTDEFPRLRVGVGPVPEGQDPADFVLERFSATEQKAFPQIFSAIDQTLQAIVTDGFEKAMNASNKSHL